MFDFYLDLFSRHYGWFIFIVYIIYFIAFFGVFSLNKSYIHTFSNVVQTIIGLFLFIRFIPFNTQSTSLKYNDKNVIFGSAIILLMNSGLLEQIAHSVLSSFSFSSSSSSSSSSSIPVQQSANPL